MGADITQWQGDWLKLTQCLENPFTSCQQVGLSKFPLAYLLNARMLDLLASVGGTLKSQMGFINGGILLLPVVVALVIKPFSIALRIAVLYVIVLFCSPLPGFYISSGALEVQSGVFIGILMTSVYCLVYENYSSKKKALLYGFLIISALLVPLYKDTNLPILFGALLVFAGLNIFYQNKGSFQFPKFRVSPFLIVGFLFLASLILVCSYNYLKYDSILPLAYLNEANLTKPPLKRSAEFLFFSLFSLNGGLMIFWMLPCFVGFMLANYLGLNICRQLTKFGAIFVGVSLLSLSLWWVPFGWDSWGNRLIVPSMLAAIIACLLTANPSLLEGHSQQDAISMRALAYQGPKNTIWGLLRLGFLGCYFVLSLGYTVITYASDHDPLFYFSLHGGVKCKEMMHEFGEQFPKVGWSFWQTKPYYKCARERFLHVPNYIVKQAQ